MKQTGILLLSCPDQKGIVAAVASFLYENNANILHADEHQDSENNLFFLRTEWDLLDFAFKKEEFIKKFSPIAQQFRMDWQVIYPEDKSNMAIFVSSEDHCLADLLYRWKNRELNCEISLIISNHPNAKPLAGFYNISFHEISVTQESKQKAEQKILNLLKKNQINLVILARYMQILSPEFIQNFAYPIINIHHSFLPAFIGAKPYHQAYERGVKIIGATAHLVTADLDQGPIIEQDTLRISHQDNVEDLVQKGKDLEKIVLSRAVKWHSEHRILTYLNKTVVFN